MRAQVRRDLEFRKAFQPPPQLVCPKLQPKLTSILEEQLVWDKQELANFSSKVLECEGSKVFRRRGSDEEVFTSATFPLKVGLPFKMEPGLLQVVCFAKEEESSGRRELVYSNVHFLPKLPTSTNPKQPPAETKVPGVIILLIESLSRVNGEHQLPKTVQVLRLIYNATLLRGLTKVGDNTFPNLVALLTGVWVGRRDGKGQEGEGHEEDKKRKEVDIDRLPFLWNAWSDLVCPTLYSEDSPNINTFTYSRRGFTSPPTTIYHRPWWLAVAKLPRKKSRSNVTSTEPHGCTLGRPSYAHQLELATNFLRETKARCSFSLVFHVALGHTTDINQVAEMDSDLADWLIQVDREGLVQDKLVLVGGDHGNRFSRSRLSLGGRIEERMPFMAVSLPRKLQDGRSKAQLDENADKLVTHFDLHKTIQSLLPSSPPAEKNQPSENTRTPISLLRPIPSNRSCSEAGVPPSYCICTPEKYLSLRSPEARKAAEALVREASRLLQPYADLCLPLGPSRLLEARRVGEAATRQVRVTIVTTTSATLEALVEGSSRGEMGVVGDINRLDYMGARDCLPDSYVQLFCTCKPTAPRLIGG